MSWPEIEQTERAIIFMMAGCGLALISLTITFAIKEMIHKYKVRKILNKYKGE